MLRQKDLQHYYLLRTKRLDLEAEARQLGKEEKTLGDVFLEELDGGEELEPGILRARIEAGDRRPKWKEAAMAELGEAWAEEVIANTIPGRRLVVEPVEQAQLIGGEEKVA